MINPHTEISNTIKKLEFLQKIFIGIILVSGLGLIISLIITQSLWSFLLLIPVVICTYGIYYTSDKIIDISVKEMNRLLDELYNELLKISNN